MAVMNRNRLVLNNVSVVCDVVTGTMDRGTNPARGKALGIPFSRCLSQRYPLADQKPGWWQDHADQHGAVHAANRAGRPGSSSRVVASPPSAPAAGRTSATRWFLATEMFCPPAASALGRFTAKRAASVVRTRAGRLLTSGVEAVRHGEPLGSPAERTAIPTEVNLAKFRLARGASSASTRG